MISSGARVSSGAGRDGTHRDYCRGCDGSRVQKITSRFPCWQVGARSESRRFNLSRPTAGYQKATPSDETSNVCYLPTTRLSHSPTSTLEFSRMNSRPPRLPKPRCTNGSGRSSRFYPHAAQHDFEAWLLPYWPRIKALADSNRNSPSPHPETVNHDKPPSKHLAEVFRTGGKKRSYSKIRDGAAILRNQDLAISATACPELKAFLNTILDLCGAAKL